MSDPPAEIVGYEPRLLAGAAALAAAEGWPSLSDDSARAGRVRAAPGVTTLLALDGGRVVGLACIQSDYASD